MHSTRSGSAILYCIILAVIAVMIGYAFLRGAARQTMSGKSEMLISLAQDAAQSAVAHATEQILIDYNGINPIIATSRGGIVIPSAPTFLDGPYRAPFVSIWRPNDLAYTEVASRNNPYLDDAPEENNVLTPLIGKHQIRYNVWHTQDRNPNLIAKPSGLNIYEARGRYVEVGYYNSTRPNPFSGDPKPVETIKFTDMAAAIPEHSDGFFLDEDLRRLTTGTPDQQRRRARYRVRYALGVEDLSGHLLSNPRADIDTDWKNPNNDYRAIPRWLVHAGYAWENMVTRWTGARTAALRMRHIFLGRGNSSNADRSWTPGARLGLPATYPDMFRQVVNRHWYGHFTYSDNASVPNLGGRIYSYPGTASYEPIIENPSGSEILTPTGLPTSKPYTHTFLGPQHSWFNQIFALQGASIPGTRSDQDVDGNAKNYSWASEFAVLNIFLTPFGRRQEATDISPNQWKWYQGRADTPWQVNLLTATPQTISEMLLAYVLPFYSGRNLPVHDLLTDQLGSGFSEFPAPSSLASDGITVIKPDYYQAADPRPIADRYPGPLARGNSNQPGEGQDDLGKDIDVDTGYGAGIRIGRCTHTNNPLLFIDGLPTNLDNSYFWDMAHAMTTAISYAKATWVQYPNTIFEVRDGKAGYGFSPTTLRDPLAYDTIEAIDALFLRQMGESFTSPGNPCAENPIISNWVSGYLRFEVCPNPVSNTIHSLVSGDLISTASGVSSIERGKVMERMLNDFRMSFFGSSPKYADFHPLDFDGDGHVHSSAYDSNGTATADEQKYKTTRWKTVVGSGQGPAPTPFMNFDPILGSSPWFSVTGCFYIGKSHFYRIFTRGEVYDNILKKPVAQQTLETVIVVDPEAPQFPNAGRIASEVRPLFKRWHYNDTTAELPRQTR